MALMVHVMSGFISLKFQDPAFLNPSDFFMVHVRVLFKLLTGKWGNSYIGN